jgi:Outer membrane protein beta-barrel domain
LNASRWASPTGSEPNAECSWIDMSAARLAILVSTLAASFSGEAAESGFYAGADLGVTEATVGKSDGIFVSLPQLPGIIFRSLPDSTSADSPMSGWSARLGYRVNRIVAAEIAYTDFGSIDIRETHVIGPFPFLGIDQFVTYSDIEAKVTGPSVNVLGILPLGDGFEVFGRAGLLFADKTSARIGVGNADSIGEELWVIGGGVDFRIARQWSGRIAYESVDGLPRDGRMGPMRLERFVFGLSYEF